MEIAPQVIPTANIKVVGVGGAGGKIINRMVRANLQGVEFVAVNTDAQDLHATNADVKVHIGKDTTKGLGAGGVPDVGLRSAEENVDDIRAALEGADMVFVVVGCGGGSGTLASSVVADVAKQDIGALTIGVATTPFSFEGMRRMSNADMGIESLREKVDALITIPNDKLLSLIDKKTSMMNAFGVVDDVVYQSVSGVSDLITRHGEMVNVDFADVKSILHAAGSAHIGIGIASGENRAIDAAKAASESPLLDVSMHGAQGILVNITGGDDLTMWEVDEAIKTIGSFADPEANIIFGVVTDETATGEISITVVATGFDSPDQVAAESPISMNRSSAFAASRLGKMGAVRSAAAPAQAPSRSADMSSGFRQIASNPASTPAPSAPVEPTVPVEQAAPAAPASSAGSQLGGLFRRKEQQAEAAPSSQDMNDPDVPAFIRKRMK